MASGATVLVILFEPSYRPQTYTSPRDLVAIHTVRAVRLALLRATLPMRRIRHCPVLKQFNQGHSGAPFSRSGKEVRFHCI